MHSYCSHAGIGLIPWSPLAQGTLARPWKDKDDSSSIRAQDNPVLAMLTDDSDKPAVDQVEETSKRLGKSMATVATALSLKKKDNPMLGLHSIARIDEAAETIPFS